MLDESIQYVFNYDFEDVQVRDLIKTKKFENAELFVTKTGLNHAIKSATVMDVENIGPWLREGDVLFISRFMRTSFTDQFIEKLSKKEISCIVTQKKFKKCVTDAQFDQLRKINLPLIFVSDDSSWSSLIVAIQNLIIQNQTKYLVENQEFQNSIINYLSNYNQQDSLCEIVHRLAGITIAIANRNLQIVDYSKDLAWDQELHSLKKKNLNDYQDIGENFNEVAVKGYLYHDENTESKHSFFIIPDRLSRYGASFYMIVQYDEDTKQLPPHIIGRIETVESIYSLKNSITSQLRKSNYYFKSVVFEDLMEMTARNEQKRNQISLNLNADLSDRYSLVLIKNVKDEKICKNVELLTGFMDYIKHKGFVNEDFLLFVYKDSWVLLIDNSVESIKSTCLSIHELLAIYFENTGFILGISNLHEYWDLKQAFNEASFAIDYLNHNINAYNSVLMYNELGIIKLFTDQNSQINSVYTHELISNYLTPILSYDANNQSALYETLITFFSNDLSYVMTSQALFIHVNTLRARLKTIEKILNIDLNRIDNIINVRLAILLHQFENFKK